MATITRHPRHRIDVEWAEGSWTHNVFRAYEMVFGRRQGIKAEMSMYLRDGETLYFCHSWESVFALSEQFIREALTFRVRVPIKIWIPMLTTPHGISMPASPYLFAIAVDNTGLPVLAVSSSPATGAYTSTGSNLILMSGVLGGVSGTDTTTAVSYNSAALTKINGLQTPSDRFAGYWYLIGPSTGSHTYSITFTGSFATGVVATYSGAAQSGQPDASTTATATSTPTFSNALTPTANNCWVTAYVNNSNQPTVAGASTTIRKSDTSSSALADTNIAVSPVASTTLNFTNSGPSSASWAIVMASIAPFTASVANSNFLSFM